MNGQSGAKRDIILLNSALAIHTARPELSIQQAIAIARQTIDSGKALAKLNQFIKLTEVGVAA